MPTISELHIDALVTHPRFRQLAQHVNPAPCQLNAHASFLGDRHWSCHSVRGCPRRKYYLDAATGSQIRDFRKALANACEAAGYPGKLFHDFRRTAVRNLERAGVPRSTAMAMVGHETESIYRRYAIVDESMHREAAALLDGWHAEQKAKAAAERKGQLRRFKKRQTA